MRFVKQAAAVLCTVILVITAVFDTQISTNALDIKTPMKSATEKFFILGSGSYTRKLILTNAGQSDTACGLSRVYDDLNYIRLIIDIDHDKIIDILSLFVPS